jgi:hypothetical protein
MREVVFINRIKTVRQVSCLEFYSFAIMFSFVMRRRVYYILPCSAIGIATGYWLDDQGVGVRVPVRSRMFSTYPVGTGGFPGGKAAGARSRPLTSSLVPRSRKR